MNSGITNMICSDCGESEDKDCFSGRHKHCRQCHYLRYGVKRTYVKLACPNCNVERRMRADAYYKRNQICVINVVPCSTIKYSRQHINWTCHTRYTGDGVE